MTAMYMQDFREATDAKNLQLRRGDQFFHPEQNNPEE